MSWLVILGLGLLVFILGLIVGTWATSRRYQHQLRQSSLDITEIMRWAKQPPGLWKR